MMVCFVVVVSVCLLLLLMVLFGCCRFVCYFFVDYDVCVCVF